ncbi:hypothetical protein FOA52_007952 [Chlamydomonas sp. UWO 241]|nr:hypothetical protein FOA52_007952 [Chlamydomonas sp. UWO 241]
MIGLLLRGGLHSLGALVWLLSKLSMTKKRKRELSWVEAIKDTVRFGAFLGAMGATYVGVDEGLAGAFGKARSARWRAAVAGAVAGQVLLITGSKTRQYSLSTYVLLRGLTLLVRRVNKEDCQRPPLLRALLAPTRMQHGDTIMMCAAASQIVYSFLMMPSTLPRSYVRFISKQSGKEPWVWKGVQEQALRNWKGETPAPLNLLRGTPHADLVSKIPCEFYHPGQSCVAHTVSRLPASYVRALGVYIPVYLVPALLVHRQRLIKQPAVLLPKVAAGIARSSLFLTLYIALAFGGACAGFRTTGTSTGPILAATVWAGGLATLAEKKSRRMELALYCASRALESFFRCLAEWGALDSVRPHLPPRLDAVMFSIGCASIMNSYSGDRGAHRDVFRAKYLNVLDFVFGNSGVGTGSIHHMPSNTDLMRAAARRLTQSMSFGSLPDTERGGGSGAAGSQSAGSLPAGAARSASTGSALHSQAAAAAHAPHHAPRPHTGEGVRLPKNSRQHTGSGVAGRRGAAGARAATDPATAPAAAPGPPPPLAQPSSSRAAAAMKRSATVPALGSLNCERRVHGTDTGIRAALGLGGKTSVQREPSLSLGDEGSGRGGGDSGDGESGRVTRLRSRPVPVLGESGGPSAGRSSPSGEPSSLPAAAHPPATSDSFAHWVASHGSAPVAGAARPRLDLLGGGGGGNSSGGSAARVDEEGLSPSDRTVRRGSGRGGLLGSVSSGSFLTLAPQLEAATAQRGAASWAAWRAGQTVVNSSFSRGRGGLSSQLAIIRDQSHASSGSEDEAGRSGAVGDASEEEFVDVK